MVRSSLRRCLVGIDPEAQTDRSRSRSCEQQAVAHEVRAALVRQVFPEQRDLPLVAPDAKAGAVQGVGRDDVTVIHHPATRARG